MTRIFLIFICTLIIVTSCNANSITLDETVSQFKDDQIACLKTKVALTEEMVKMLKSKKVNEKRYKEIIKLRETTYNCRDDHDDEFMDMFIGIGYTINKEGQKVKQP
jgi:hypothetical protein